MEASADGPHGRRARTAALPGMDAAALDRLARVRVLVVGAGGLGSPVIQYLAAAGVGALGIVDDDIVDETNLQRQTVHGAGDVGERKVLSAARAVARLDPALPVTAIDRRLDAANALDILDGWDVVVDASDNLATRYLLSDAAALAGLPCVWGSVLRYEGEVTVFGEAAPGGGVDYRDLHPVPPPPETVLDCAEAGVLGSLCGVIGSVMAGEVVKLATGVGTPLRGRVLHHDALEGNWRELRLRRAPDRIPVTALADDYLAFCGIRSGPTAERDGGPAEIALDAAGGRTAVDVREASERELGHLPGDRWVPLARLLDDPAAAGRGPLLVYCASGRRSAVAAAALRDAGVDAVSLAGGWDGVSAAGEGRQHIDDGTVGQH